MKYHEPKFISKLKEGVDNWDDNKAFISNKNARYTISLIIDGKFFHIRLRRVSDRRLEILIPKFKEYFETGYYNPNRYYIKVSKTGVRDFSRVFKINDRAEISEIFSFLEQEGDPFGLIEMDLKEIDINNIITI